MLFLFPLLAFYSGYLGSQVNWFERAVGIILLLAYIVLSIIQALPYQILSLILTSSKTSTSWLYAVVKNYKR